MRLHNEADLVERILIMEGVGFRASEQDSLPLLFKEVYGFEMKRNCSNCVTESWNSLIKWANKKSKPTNNSMGLRIKKEYENQNFPARVGGKLMLINSKNLNEERARILLSIPKYAHAIEGQPDKPVKELLEVKGKGDLVEKGSPNALGVSTASTSTEAKGGGQTVVKAVKGKLTKVQVESKQLKGKGGKGAK